MDQLACRFAAAEHADHTDGIAGRGLVGWMLSRKSGRLFLRLFWFIIFHRVIPFIKSESEYKYNRQTRMAAGAAPRDFHPRVVLTRPYSLPATPRCLKTVARSDYDDKGVPLFLPRVLARKLPYLLHGEGVDRSLPMWEVMAHPPPGSARKGCIRLPYAAAELSAGLSLSVSRGARMERGAKHSLPVLVQFRSKPRIDTISFVSSRRRKSSSTWE